ncbi:hypothetical protein NLU13_6593 [Sarocladium strictum]|uniref:ATP-dependent RNA helicase n=1 Tax=Sarocladium strictum TaxID=5046 RepID=A0AA39GIM4_SARSR|nr:hypothetical protein NLU13_6593 [Sarocladium strictum]
MAPEAKKRKLQSANTPASKRPKNHTKPAKASAKKSQKQGQTVPRKVVDASALAWESLGEDFGGLEVIRNVKVIRNGDRVQFSVAESGNDDKDTKTTTDTESNNITDNDTHDEGESFEGFGDDDLEGQAGHSNDPSDREAGLASSVSEEVDRGRKQKQSQKQQKPEQKKKTGKDKEQENGRVDGSKKGVQKSASQGNAFGALANVDESAGEEDDGPEVDMKAWAALTLSQPMLSAVAALKFAKPTKIQAEAVPEIMAGEDVIGKAQTGSGKTLAFGIPMVEKWLELREAPSYERKGPLAVVLSPTRELAKQLGDHMKALCNGLPGNAPYVCVVTGGLSIQKQQRQLEKADIVVGTPGRLWEVLEGDMKLQDAFTRLRFLVVDEADRIFKAGQFKEVEDILGALDKKDPEADEDSSSDEEEDDEEDGDDGKPARQTLVFSATFDKNLQTKLAGKLKFGGKKEDNSMEYLLKSLKFRRQPKFIDVNPVSQMATGLREGLIECGAMEKDLHLYAAMVLNPNRRTLVFTNSISAVRRLTPLLQNLNLPALPLHSQMAQKARLRSIERFSTARSTVLVATDVAARGLDIKDVEQVVHYHVPRTADTYIHRSGRTARGESSGVSILLCAPDEVIPTRRLAAKVHAQRSNGGSKDHLIQTLPLNRTILTRLKPRVDLAKKLADAVLAKEKGNGDDAWLRNAAEDLGVEYDPEEFEGAELGHGGRGGGRKKKEKEARSLTKAEMGALRAQLREELSRRVNLGVSEKYITGGRVDVAALLREKERATVGGLFLGGEGLGLDL